jgi:site-specific DNA-methyltransferase (adenine-specific)
LGDVRPEIAARLFNEDCIGGLARIPSGSVDMVLADPPYGTTNNAWDVPLPLDPMWRELKRVCRPCAAMLFFSQCPYDKVLGASNLPMLRYEWIWLKSRQTGFLNATRAPLKITENVLVFSSGQTRYNPQMETGRMKKVISPTLVNNHPNYRRITVKPLYGKVSYESDKRFPLNVLPFPSEVFVPHPTQKPVALCEYLILTYTDPGDVVLDICAGSGTTAVAAVNTGRDWLAFEKEPGYCAVAAERIGDAMAAQERSLFFKGFPGKATEPAAEAAPEAVSTCGEAL